MDEELDYAEMLEIPVETITVKRKEKRKKAQDPDDLRDTLVDRVNDRVGGDGEDDPAYAESTPIAREEPAPKKRRGARAVLIAEFVAVCLLCATIFLTNIFLSDSAINTFVRGLVQGNSSTADTRTYHDFTLSPVVNDYTEAEITVSSTGVMSFTQKCSVYAPCAGTVTSVSGSEESGYTVEIKHSDSFSTIMSGLDTVYAAQGETVRANLPLGYTDGEGEVRVMFYDGQSLLNCYTVDGENGLSWS